MKIASYNRASLLIAGAPEAAKIFKNQTADRCRCLRSCGVVVSGGAEIEGTAAGLGNWFWLELKGSDLLRL